MHVCLMGSGGCGIVALLLLAGVACFAFLSLFWVLISRARRHQHAGEREDRISELPDEIINMIISRLSAINAARTSVLSRRWRHVYAFTTNIKFPCSCHYYHAGKNLSQSPTKFVRAVDTFLQNHSGSKITSFELVCCFYEHILGSFRNWLNHVGNMGVEQLTIGYTCPQHVQEFKSPVFSSDFLPQASSVKRLCLKGAVFRALNQNSLKDLEMSSVAFTSQEIKCILSNCSSLQSLKLTHCVLPSRLCIHGPDLRLKSLTVLNCLGAAEIDLSAMDLTDFVLYDFQMMELSFTCVPLLQNLYIETRKDDSVRWLFKKIADDLPQLKCLVFQNTATSLQLSNVFKIGEVDGLGSLRQLSLFLKYYTKLDLQALATVVLDVCPLLHKFSLSMEHSSTCDGKPAENRVVRRHTELKEVEFCGFNETENEYHFILYILNNVVFLERLSISVPFKYQDLELGCWLADSRPRVDEEKRRSIGRRLQGQALANNVGITIL